MLKDVRSAVPNFGFQTAPRESFLSCLVAFFIPVILGLYWPLYSVAPDTAILMLRPAILGTTAVLALLWYKAPLTRAELRAAALMALLCAIWLMPSLAATLVSRAMTDWAKLAILCVVSLFVARGLRHEASSKAFGLGLILSSIVLAVFIILIYVRYMGMVLPTYESARIFKGAAAKNNITLNAIGFGSVFAYIAGMCLVRANRMLWALGFSLFIIASVFTGSRTPPAILVVSGIALLMINGLRSQRLATRLVTYVILIGGLAGVALVLTRVPFKKMSAVTEGRWDLWSVGWEKFTERPFLGYGFESWRDDLVSRLPGEYSLTLAIAEHIAGGYHNEYVTILAEEGLAGLLPALALMAFLFHSSFQLAFRKFATWKHGQWALFGCLFVLFRAGVEVPGLFGYGQEPADFLAYFFISIVVSRMSIEEMYARSFRRVQAKDGPALARHAKAR